MTLAAPAPPGGAVVTLSSDHPPAAGAPASVTVPEGSTTATFPVTTHLVPATTSVLLSASYGGATWTTALQVWHVALASISAPASRLGGGVSFVGTVTLDSPALAAAGDAIVTLASDNLAVVRLPESVVVKARQTTATFQAETLPVASDTTVILSAS